MDMTLSSRLQAAHAPESDAGLDSARAESCCGGEVALTPSLDATQSTTLADRLKALADPTRLRLLDLLAQQARPLCVCELTAQFDLHQPTISHHLRILREAQLIYGERRGVWSYYAATNAGRRCLFLVRELL